MQRLLVGLGIESSYCCSTPAASTLSAPEPTSSWRGKRQSIDVVSCRCTHRAVCTSETRWENGASSGILFDGSPRLPVGPAHVGSLGQAGQTTRSGRYQRMRCLDELVLGRHRTLLNEQQVIVVTGASDLSPDGHRKYTVAGAARSGRVCQHQRLNDPADRIGSAKQSSR